jgi:hypothetical protein
MKRKKKNGKGHYLQTRNNRWKWMAGATAATAAGVTTSQASLITVNLTNNYISFNGGNHLNADLTGDGHPDLTIANARISTIGTFGDTSHRKSGYVKAELNGVLANWLYSAEFTGFVLRLGSQYTVGIESNPPNALTGSIPIFFKDLHINSGAPTTGLLEVTVSPSGGVQLDSFTYTSNTPGAGRRVSAVPDEGSTLALLAMGAGGVLALRRRRVARKPT